MMQKQSQRLMGIAYEILIEIPLLIKFVHSRVFSISLLSAWFQQGHHASIDSLRNSHQSHLFCTLIDIFVLITKSEQCQCKIRYFNSNTLFNKYNIENLNTIPLNRNTFFVCNFFTFTHL